MGEKTYAYYSLPAAEEAGLAGVSRLPVSMKVLLENLLRNEDGVSVSEDDLKAIAAWIDNKGAVEHEISFRPARVLMQDFTGVPAVVDLAAMRDAMAKLGGDPSKINPLNPVDLVIDHSVMVDYFGTRQGLRPRTSSSEYERNLERYRFLRWGSSAFNNFRVVPPGTGICHQVNLEYLAQTVWTRPRATTTVAYPGHRGRHRQPHHHGQRPVGAGLGRRRHRGGGGHARPADPDADPRGDRLPARPAPCRKARRPPTWC